jgi:uncharacterized protein
MPVDWQASGPVLYRRMIWHRDKAASNAKKHGITFENASQVFEGQHLTGEIFEGGEWRGVAIGSAFGALVLLVFIEPEEDVCRLISARRATAGERRTYRELLG